MLHTSNTSIKKHSAIVILRTKIKLYFYNYMLVIIDFVKHFLILYNDHYL